MNTASLIVTCGCGTARLTVPEASEARKHCYKKEPGGRSTELASHTLSFNWLLHSTSNQMALDGKSRLDFYSTLHCWMAVGSDFDQQTASDGWYRRWIHRWKKYALLHDEEEGSQVTSSTTTSEKQVAIVDRMKILHDVASQQLSPEILKSQSRIRGHTDCGTVTALETELETSCSKSVVNSLPNYNADLNEIQQQQQLHFGVSHQLQNIDHLSNLHFQQESPMNNVAFTSEQQMGMDQMRGSSSLLTQIQNISTNSTLNSYEFLKFSVPIKKASAIDFVEIAEANTMPHQSSETSQDIAGSIFGEVGFTLPADANHNTSAKMTISSKIHGLLPLKQHSDLMNLTVAKKHVEKQIPNSTSSRKIVSKKKNVSLSGHSKTPQHKKGERYLPQFKERVLAYAANHTFKDTARKFRVNNETVSAWKKDKISAQMSDGVEKVASKQVANIPVVTPLDDQFVLWLRRCRQKNRELDHEEVRDKARQLVAQCGVEKEAHKHCRWFIMFNKRPYEDGMELWRSSNEKEYHIQYPHSFKMEIAAFAERHSQILAAKVFNVTRKRVFEWLKTFRKKGETAEERKDVESESKGVAGRSVTNSEVDHQIWAWYQAHEQTKRPSSKEIRSKACELYRAHGHADIKCSYGWYKKWSDRFQVVRRHEHDDKMLEWVLTQMEQGRTLNHGDLQAQAVLLNKNSQFKASPGWALRFCKRHPKLLRHRPTLETELPSDLLHKVELFRFTVQKLIREKAISLAAVGNMDELHLNFTISLPGSGTNWKRHLLLRRPDMDNCHATVVLACLADGNMLPPMLILKENSDVSPDLESFEVSLAYQKNAQMDLTTMKTWLERIWFKQVLSPSLLITDCYEPHCVPNITDMFRTRGCHCAVIPGGCTSRLQPLDITVKREFQVMATLET
uniref:HTH CENPB-type domain-containing protein n=1 Tax=Timema bartmani TaxID=61472 RepID=A0A7R9EWR5_9NEOP|nr:unnamed protein product [Timema bartmani]